MVTRIRVKNMCDICGKEYSVNPWKIKYNINHGKKNCCSKACATRCQKPRKNIEMITIKCFMCGKEKEITMARYRTKVKAGNRICCSKECANSCPRGKRVSSVQRDLQRALQNITTRIKRKGPIDCNIDLEYCLELYNKQKGLCYITNIPMIGRYSTKENHSPYQISIDRIDSSKGYLKGNVCLVCLAVNYGKNSFTLEQIKQFFCDIKTHLIP